MSNSPERSESTPEVKSTANEAAAEQLEKLANSPEDRVEMSPRDAEQSAERARHEALENAVSVEAGGKEKKKPNESTPTKRGAISKSAKNASFKRHMKDIQQELPPVTRAFSKFIHNKAVEKTSEALGATIARPNAILAGSVTAFVLVLGVYVVAKTIGYSLSGSETIVAFIIGWILGIVYDYLRIIVTGKK